MWWHQSFIFPDLSLTFTEKNFPLTFPWPLKFPDFSSLPWPVGTLSAAYIGRPHRNDHKNNNNNNGNNDNDNNNMLVIKKQRLVHCTWRHTAYSWQMTR